MKKKSKPIEWRDPSGELHLLPPYDERDRFTSYPDEVEVAHPNMLEGSGWPGARPAGLWMDVDGTLYGVPEEIDETGFLSDELPTITLAEIERRNQLEQQLNKG